MGVSVNITATTGSGQTLEQLGKVLQERMKYMRETARDSIAAVAIQVLRGVRAITKVAKDRTIKVKVDQDGSLYPSFYTEGHRKYFCLRSTATKSRYRGTETVVSCQKGVDMKSQKVYRFVDVNARKPKTYLIVAFNQREADNRAKRIAKKRALRYAGLAKRAVSMLMFKTNTKKVNDGALNPLVETKAMSVTSKNERVTHNGDGGTYTLVLNDALNYALNAIKGGRSAVDTQMKKAMNKVVSVINQKLKNSKEFFGTKKLPTPFPDLVRKRK